MTQNNIKAERYQIIEVIKFGMLFGYKIVDVKAKDNEAIYEYGETELLRAKSKVNLMNLLNKED